MWCAVARRAAQGIGWRRKLIKQAAENDTFEDAVDSSVRSLTKRSVSASKPVPSPEAASDDGSVQQKADDRQGTTPVETDDVDDSKDANDDATEHEDKPKTLRKSSSHSRGISSTSNLDNVNLDDEAPPTEGTLVLRQPA